MHPLVKSKEMEHVEGSAVERYRKLSAWDSHRSGKLQLPPGYHLGLDADLKELRSADRSLAVVFSVRGATRSEVSRAAKEDYRANGKTSA